MIAGASEQFQSAIQSVYKDALFWVLLQGSLWALHSAAYFRFADTVFKLVSQSSHTWIALVTLFLMNRLFV